MKAFKGVWIWIGAVLTGAIGSIVAAIIFEGRLPNWLMKPKEEARPAMVIDWWHLGGIVGGVSVVALIILFVLMRRRPMRPSQPKPPKPPPEPSISEYNKDEFFGLTWRWHYGSDRSIDGACFCPRCDRQLTATEVDRWPSVYAWSCSVHGELYRKQGPLEAILDDAIREIQLNIRNGRWKQVVAQQQINRN